MNVLLRMYPGDDWGILIAEVLLQVTVVALAAWLLARLGGRWNAAWRYAVWLIALVCVLVSPALSYLMQATGATLVTLPAASPAAPADSSTVPVRQPGLTETAVPATTEGAHPITEGGQAHFAPKTAQNEPVPDGSVVLRALGGAALAVWVLGVALLALRWCHGLYLAAALRRAVQPLDPAVAAEPLRQVRQALGAERLPPMATSAGVDRPVMVGLIRPLVILPESVRQTLPEAELADVLIHECAHAVCRHQVVGLLQRAAGVLFWPHPLVCVLNRELARAREEVCDNYVLQRGDARRYAQTLLDVSQSLVGSSPRPVAIGLFHGRWKLDDRIAGLLDRRRKTMTGVNRWTAAALTALFLLLALTIAGTRVARAVPIEYRSVNKTVEDLSQKPDLSTPEAAMVALCRAWAHQDVDAVRELSWPKMDLPTDTADRRPESMAKTILDTEVATVLTYRDDLAAVVTRMNISRGGRPIITWHFGRIDGEWKNVDFWAGMDLSYESVSVEQAAQRFAADKDMLWRYFEQVKKDVEKRRAAESRGDEAGSAAPAMPSISAKQQEEIKHWQANTWRLGLELDASEMGLPAVQFAVLDHDPVPGYVAELKRMQSFYRPQLEKVDTEAWKEQQRRSQMQVSWDAAGFQDVAGVNLGLLVGRQGNRFWGVTRSSNGPGGKKWVVTKAEGAEGKVVCWCIPVEVKTGEEVHVTLNKDNVFDLRTPYDEAMKEPADSDAGEEQPPK